MAMNVNMTLHRGEGITVRNPGYRLMGMVGAFWAACVELARRLDGLAEVHPNARMRARLRVKAAFARAWASRLLALKSGLGRGPLPIPKEETPGTLREEGLFMLRMAAIFTQKKQEVEARFKDVAWRLELCAVEMRDLGQEMLKDEEEEANGRATHAQGN